MTAFTLSPRPAITGAPGALDQISDLLMARSITGPVLAVVDPVLSIGGWVSDLIRRARATPMMAELPLGEPKESFVASICRAGGFEAVICVGGGSAIDAGKMIAAIGAADVTVAAYRLAATPLPKRSVPLIAVPTTSGTGAEATTVSILGADDGTKYWFLDEMLRPDHIILDPVLTVGLPAPVTAMTGMDALVHALEAATNRKTTTAILPYTRSALEGVRGHLYRAVRVPSDLDARAGMQMAATFAGLAIDNAGTGIAHAVGHALGSLQGTPHGLAVTIGLCATLAWSIEGYELHYLDAARALGLDSPKELPGAVTDLAHMVGLDLSVQGLTVETLAAQIARPENQAMLQASLRPVTEADITLFAERVLALSHKVAA